MRDMTRAWKLATATRRRLSNKPSLPAAIRGRNQIFIATDISMNDSVTFEIISRRKGTVAILGMTITFTTVDDLTNPAECEISVSELT